MILSYDLASFVLTCRREGGREERREGERPMSMSVGGVWGIWECQYDGLEEAGKMAREGGREGGREEGREAYMELVVAALALLHEGLGVLGAPREGGRKGGREGLEVGVGGPQGEEREGGREGGRVRTGRRCPCNT